LTRGDKPEAVIQRIADFRADDKPNPDYYARHTVTKALTEIEQAKARNESNDRNQAVKELPDSTPHEH